MADKVILEVNAWQPTELEGMHDVYYGTALPPNGTPIQITEPSDRIGSRYLHEGFFGHLNVALSRGSRR